MVISDDYFPDYIKKGPTNDAAIVLTWTHLDKDKTYGIYSPVPERYRGSLVPEWMIEKYSSVIEPLADQYWLEKIDTKFV